MKRMKKRIKKVLSQISYELRDYAKYMQDASFTIRGDK